MSDQEHASGHSSSLQRPLIQSSSSSTHLDEPSALNSTAYAPSTNEFGTKLHNPSPETRGGGVPSAMPLTSSLYSAVISPKEMAAHEAANFKNVKGVYKNCRGIWAAQWTDERGQRHTKYFNPKYFATEAEARHEAFRFKVHIAREIELRGGVQKRRAPTVGAGGRSGDMVLDHAYMRDRQRRVQRRCPNKMGLRFMLSSDSTMTSATFLPCSSGLGNGHPYSLGTASSSCFDDMLLQRHVNSLTPQDFMRYEPSLAPNSTGHLDVPPSSLGSPSTQSPNSSPPSLGSDGSAGAANQVYFTTALDPLYAGSAGPHQSQLALGNIPMQSQGGPPLLLPGESSATPHSNLPPAASLCFCGCGALALAPARYAPHHKPGPLPPPPLQFPLLKKSDGTEQQQQQQQPMFPNTAPVTPYSESPFNFMPLAQPKQPQQQVNDLPVASSPEQDQMVSGDAATGDGNKQVTQRDWDKAAPAGAPSYSTYPALGSVAPATDRTLATTDEDEEQIGMEMFGEGSQWTSET